MIGWLGPDTSAGELFEAIPALNFIVAWDGGAQRYRWVWRASLGLQALPWIQGGRGWPCTSGASRPSSGRARRPRASYCCPLRAGNNLVTWGGLDGTPIEEALDWLGDAVVGASRWNADTRESERYRPGAPPSANTLRTLNHGDALWVQLSEDASWWQSATAEHGVRIRGAPASRDGVGASWGSRGRAGVLLRELWPGAGRSLGDCCSGSFNGRHTAAGVAYPGEIHYVPADRSLTARPEPDFPIRARVLPCVPVAVSNWAQGPANFFELPNWLIEGTAVYAEDVYPPGTAWGGRAVGSARTGGDSRASTGPA